jgi:hypothetical protein
MLKIKNIHKIEGVTIAIPIYAAIYTVKQPVIETDRYRFPIESTGACAIGACEFELWRTRNGDFYQLDLVYDRGKRVTTMHRIGELGINGLLSNFQQSLTSPTQANAPF